MKFPNGINRLLTAWYLKRKGVTYEGVLPRMNMLRPPQFYIKGKLELGSGVKFFTHFGPIVIKTDEEAVVKIGSNSVLNGSIWIRSALEVTIGEDALIAPDTKIFDHNVHPVSVHDTQERLPVRLGRNVWIASNCLISPGTIIGQNSAVGWGSRTKGKYPCNAFIAGNPAAVIEISVNPPNWIREDR